MPAERKAKWLCSMLGLDQKLAEGIVSGQHTLVKEGENRYAVIKDYPQA